MRYRRRRSAAVAAGGCGSLVGCRLICLIIGLLVGGFCFDYSLYSYFGKEIPWYADCVCGLFTAPINVPATVVAFVLRCCGIEAPFFEG
jgi:hypothetical protein